VCGSTCIFWANLTSFSLQCLRFQDDEFLADPRFGEFASQCDPADHTVCFKANPSAPGRPTSAGPGGGEVEHPEVRAMEDLMDAMEDLGLKDDL
jgi:hypothetical protein